MLVDFVDTGWYISAMVALCLIFLGLGVFIVFCFIRIHNLRDTNEGVEDLEKYKNARFHRDVSICCEIVIVSLFTYGIYQHFEYVIEDEFAWTYEEQKSIHDCTFNVVERTEAEEMELYEKRLHVDWYDGVFGLEDANITQSVLDAYDKNVKGIFWIVPQQDNIIRRSDIDNKITEKKLEFEKIVSSDNSTMEPEELWQGFLLGEDVIKVYYTSENVFQMAVLAESAHENARRAKCNINTTIVYSAGSVEKFEEFLRFSNRDAGGGVIVLGSRVGFRVGKMLYNDSKDYKNENDKMEKHCGVYSYSCFKLAEEMTDSSDPNYLLYLYYRGLGCLNIIPLIKDVSLCKKICGEELDKWQKLEEELGKDFIDRYNVENKSAGDIIIVRDMLESYIK